jgi:putative membrane protein insertion efficiency factor
MSLPDDHASIDEVIRARSDVPRYRDLPVHSRSQRFLLRWIDRYQRAAEGRPSPCRFFPSCSEYGAEAIHLHGAGRGSWLTMRRLVRCRPFGPSGFDPVPLPDPQER